MCIENRFAGWRLCVCSRVNSKACLGVTVRNMPVPRVKMGLFAKWKLEKNSSTNSLLLSDQWGFKLPVTTAQQMSRDADPLHIAVMLATYSLQFFLTCLFLLSWMLLRSDTYMQLDHLRKFQEKCASKTKVWHSSNWTHAHLHTSLFLYTHLYSSWASVPLGGGRFLYSVCVYCK